MADELLAVVVGLLVAGAGTGLLIPVLRRVQLMDVPNHRSSHVDVTPRGGGIALLLALLAAVVVTALSRGSAVGPLLTTVLAASVLLAVVGLADDARSLPSRYRLVAQVAAAAIVAGAAMTVEPAAGLLLAVVSLVGYVSYVNAYNFMDGVNGISALSTAVAGAWYWWLAAQEGLVDTGLVAAGLVGAAMGFLPWNLRGRVFLGDVGSYGVGALIAGLAVTSWATGAPAVAAIAPLLVYLADTGSALVTRAVRGERLGEPHRGHVYQRLVDGAGWSHLQVSLLAATSSAVVCVLVGLGAGAPVLLAAAALVVAAYLVTPALLVRTRRSRIDS